MEFIVSFQRWKAKDKKGGFLSRKTLTSKPILDSEHIEPHTFTLSNVIFDPYKELVTLQ